MPEILSIKEIEKKGKLQSKAPRVCIVNDFFPPVYSGAGTQAFRLGSRLVRLGIKVSVLTPYSSSLPTHEKMNGMDVNRINIRNVNSRIGPWIYNICLARTLIKTRHTYDIVHFFAAGVSCQFSILVLKALGKKIIITSSMLGGDDLMAIRRQRFGCLRMWLFSYADTFVSISPQITDVSLKASKGNVNIVEIPYGVGTDKFAPVNSTERMSIRTKLNIPADAYVAVFVGAVIRRKGADFLVNAWCEVTEQLANARLFMIGPRDIPIIPNQQEFTSQLDQFISDHNMRNNIHFLETENVSLYLKAADVFVFPSNKEGLPNAVVEAIACGLPVVVQRKPWVIMDLIEDKVNGYILEGEDKVDLAQRLIKLGKNPEVRIKMGQASRSKAIKCFSLDEKVQEYVNLYKQLTMA